MMTSKYMLINIKLLQNPYSYHCFIEHFAIWYKDTRQLDSTIRMWDRDISNYMQQKVRKHKNHILIKLPRKLVKPHAVQTSQKEGNSTHEEQDNIEGGQGVERGYPGSFQHTWLTKQTSNNKCQGYCFYYIVIQLTDWRKLKFYILKAQQLAASDSTVPHRTSQHMASRLRTTKNKKIQILIERNWIFDHSLLSQVKHKSKKHRLETIWVHEKESKSKSTSKSSIHQLGSRVFLLRLKNQYP